MTPGGALPAADFADDYACDLRVIKSEGAPLPPLESCQRYPHLRWHKMGGNESFPVACKSWKCPYCAPNLAKFYRWRLAEWARVLDLSRFMTLTLDPSKAWRKGEWKHQVVREAAKAGLHPHEPGFRQWYSWKYIKRIWNIFLTNLRRRFPGLQYIAIMEPQKNGVMHLHVFMNQYIHFSRDTELWKNGYTDSCISMFSLISISIFPKFGISGKDQAEGIEYRSRQSGI